jgi:hypothetical protein
MNEFYNTISKYYLLITEINSKNAMYLGYSNGQAKVIIYLQLAMRQGMSVEAGHINKSLDFF